MEQGFTEGGEGEKLACASAELALVEEGQFILISGLQWSLEVYVCRGPRDQLSQGQEGLPGTGTPESPCSCGGGGIAVMGGGGDTLERSLHLWIVGSSP